MKKLILFFIFTLSVNLTTSFITQAQITEVADICPGSCSSSLAFPTLFNGKVYFQANSTTSGIEVWQYDGTNAPSLLYDIVPGTGSSIPANFMVYNSKLYFTVNNSRELWSYDGTNTPSLAYDFATDYIATAIFQNKIYVLAGTTIWSYDGTTATNLGDLSGIGVTPYGFLGSTATTLYLLANSATYGTEIWRYSGSGFPAVMDIYAGSNSGISLSSAVINGSTLYFCANDGTHGTELWSQTGTGNPAMVYDLNFGTADGALGFGGMVVLNGKVYFMGSSGANGNEVWYYDGVNTPFLLSDINPGTAGSSPQWLTTIGAELFFNADDGTHGQELWKSDGAFATSMVEDVAAGALDFNPQHIFGFNSKIYMRGEGDGSDGEFWVYDELATAVDAAEADNNSRIYPNPLRTAELPKINSTEPLTNVRVTTIVGEEVYHGNTLQTINKPGVYFVELEQNGKRSIQRVIVQ
ncbi:MAG: hypothetical protein JWM14_699 [Chitinophagaceae bacterium]|nr:hypothetical protein [Chitinophagaceae bacterium]